jgi:hypothetical protein
VIDTINSEIGNDDDTNSYSNIQNKNKKIPKKKKTTLNSAHG